MQTLLLRLLWLNFSVGVAIVDHRQTNKATSISYSSAVKNTPLRGEENASVQMLTVTDTKDLGDKPSSKFANFNQDHCKWMALAWLLVACCSACLFAVVGEKAGNVCQTLVCIFVVFYVIDSGLLGAWWSGQPVKLSCQLMCWIVFFQLLLAACLCCMTVCFGTMTLAAVFVIKNATIKKMHQEYEEKKLNLSGPRRAYYESELFQQKCDRMFQEADADGNGELSMAELQPVITRELGDSGELYPTFTLAQAFDENGNSTVEKAEFVHMMQYLSMMKFTEGKMTEANAWEVLQLDPQTATHADVKKTYRRMSLQYHPDKRPLVAEDIKKKDMAEINDAKAILDAKFEPIGGQP